MTAINSNPKPVPNPAPTPRAYKFPAAAELVNAIVGNLVANNGNPEALEAAKEARDSEWRSRDTAATPAN